MVTLPSRPLTRRGLLRRVAAGAAAGGAWLACPPWVRTARGARELRVGMAHHWVPGANEVMRAVIAEGCARLGLTAQVDFYSTGGRQQPEQIEREAREQAGHDIIGLADLGVYRRRALLEPLDDVMAELIRRHGEPATTATRVALVEGVWRAIPAPALTSIYPVASRLDYWERYAGIDLRALFPADGKRDDAAVAGWTWDAYLAAARKLHAAGHPVGSPISLTSDANDWLRPLFLSFGAVPVDAKGNVTIDSDATRHVLEFLTRLVEVMPAEIFEWDDLGNNRYLIRGHGSAIINPPSAWAVARTGRPDVAAHVWHHDMPAGPAGRYRGCLPHFLGVWRFARKKEAAKALLLHLWEPEVQQRLLAAAQGYDMPAFSRYLNHPVWRTAGPPEGTLYNYPVRGDERLITAGHPAPPAVALGIDSSYILPNLVTRVVRGGDRVAGAIGWAVRELESFKQ